MKGLIRLCVGAIALYATVAQFDTDYAVIMGFISGAVFMSGISAFSKTYC